MITVGGPPFGHRGDLAVKFINHASKFSDVVAFIYFHSILSIKVNFTAGDKIQNLRLINSIPLSSEFYFLIEKCESGIKHVLSNLD